MHQPSMQPHSDVLSAPPQEAATPTAGTSRQVPSPVPQPAQLIPWHCNLHQFTFKLLHHAAN